MTTYVHQAALTVEISLTLERKGQIFFFPPYIGLKDLFYFYFCYTVGLCWLSILNVAVCTRKGQNLKEKHR